MWSRAAWFEGTRSVEGVIPSTWTDGKNVLWPPVFNATKHIKELRPPGPTWKKFKLIKVKLTSDSQQLCDDYELTTSAETDDNEQHDVPEQIKRQVKRKLHPDFTDADMSLDQTDDCVEESLSNQCIVAHTSHLDVSEISFPIPPKKYCRQRSRSGSDDTILARSAQKDSHGAKRDQRRESRSRSDTIPSSTPRSVDTARSAQDSHGARRIQQRETRSRSDSNPRSNPRSVDTARSAQDSHGARRIQQRESRSRSDSNPRSNPRSVDTARSAQDSRGARRIQRRETRSRSDSNPRSNPRSVDTARSAQDSRGPRRIQQRESRSRSDSNPRSNPRSVGTARSAQDSRCARRSPQLSKSTSRKTSFPMSEPKFQKRVLFMLADLTDAVKQICQKYKPVDSTFHITKVDTLEEFRDLEELLKDQQRRSVMINQLSKIGGNGVKDITNNILHRLLSNAVMAQMSAVGRSGKLAYDFTLTAQVVQESVSRNVDASEALIRKTVMAILKYAKYRKDGDVSNDNEHQQLRASSSATATRLQPTSSKSSIPQQQQPRASSSATSTRLQPTSSKSSIPQQQQPRASSSATSTRLQPTSSKSSVPQQQQPRSSSTLFKLPSVKN